MGLVSKLQWVHEIFACQKYRILSVVFNTCEVRKNLERIVFLRESKIILFYDSIWCLALLLSPSFGHAVPRSVKATPQRQQWRVITMNVHFNAQEMDRERDGGRHLVRLMAL